MLTAKKKKRKNSGITIFISNKFDLKVSAISKVKEIFHNETFSIHKKKYFKSVYPVTWFQTN